MTDHGRKDFVHMRATKRLLRVDAIRDIAMGKIIGFERGLGVDSTSLQVVIDNWARSTGAAWDTLRSLARDLLRIDDFSRGKAVIARQNDYEWFLGDHSCRSDLPPLHLGPQKSDIELAPHQSVPELVRQRVA